MKVDPKPLPKDADTEREIVGALMAWPRLVSEVAAVLSPEDFTRPNLAAVYRAIVDLDARGLVPDVLSVNAAMGTGVDPLMLRDLTSDVGVPEATIHHAQRLADLAVSRRLAVRLYDASRSVIEHPEDPASMAAAVSGELLDITAHRTTEGRSVVALIDEAVAQMEAGGVTGLATGFRGLDYTLGGMLDGQLILVAARPGIGKTSFVSAVAHNVAIAKHPTLFFSYEMSAEEIATRLVCSEAGVSYHEIRAGRASLDDWSNLVAAVGTFADAPLTIADAPGAKLADLRAQARRVKDLALVIVDYIQLMPSSSAKGANRQEQVGEISRGLKLLARELRVPVLACCQLNRGLEMRQDKRPKLPDLRESGALEQDADVVILLHRDDQNPAHAELNVAKQRNGPTDVIKITFERQHTSFRDVGWA